jgi:hypothetical protein
MPSDEGRTTLGFVRISTATSGSRAGKSFRVILNA